MTLKVSQIKHWVPYTRIRRDLCSIIFLIIITLAGVTGRAPTVSTGPRDTNGQHFIPVCYFTLKLYLLITTRIVKLIFVRLMIFE